MKTFILGVAIALIIAQTHRSFANEISSIPWTPSNLKTLNRSDKGAVEAFVNQLRGDDPSHAVVGAFGWYDLNGDEQYDLVVTDDLSDAHLRAAVNAIGLGTRRQAS